LSNAACALAGLKLTGEEVDFSGVADDEFCRYHGIEMGRLRELEREVRKETEGMLAVLS
jgi:hypothetical protein